MVSLHRYKHNYRSCILFLFSLILFSILIVTMLDYVILPNYVGYNNEHYLPDVRGEYIEKAAYKLRLLGLNIGVVVSPYSNSYIP